jgi:hypothetical protein
MINVQNELRYAIAWNILKKLLLDGVLSEAEFDVAHQFVVEQYGPMTVRR